MRQNSGGLGDHPFIVVLGLIGALIAIIVYLTGKENIFQLFNIQNVVSSQPTTIPDCSLTTEIGPWQYGADVVINQDRDGWVQADFWSPVRQLVEGYDEVSVIFEPSLRVTISGSSGIAWKYDRSWSREAVQWCTEKHVTDSWNIRHKSLVIVDTTTICSILACR